MLEKMFQDMLAKALPPEVMALLSPEKMKELGDTVSAYISNTRESLARIEAQNDAILLHLRKDDQVPHLTILEGGKSNG